MAVANGSAAAARIRRFTAAVGAQPVNKMQSLLALGLCCVASVSATTCALATDKASCVAEQKPNINAQGISCTTDPKTNTGKYCGCVYTPGTAKTMVCTDTATKNVLTCISTNSPVVNPKVCTSS